MPHLGTSESLRQALATNRIGPAEAEPRDGRISNESPVGVALMGRKKGEKVVVQAPSGPIEYTLVSIG